MTASHALSQLSYGPVCENHFFGKCLMESSLAFRTPSSNQFRSHLSSDPCGQIVAKHCSMNRRAFVTFGGPHIPLRSPYITVT